MKSGLRLAWLSCRQLLPVGLLVLAPAPAAAETAQNPETAGGTEYVRLESVDAAAAVDLSGEEAEIPSPTLFSSVLVEQSNDSLPNVTLPDVELAAIEPLVVESSGADADLLGVDLSGIELAEAASDTAIASESIAQETVLEEPDASDADAAVTGEEDAVLDDASGDSPDTSSDPEAAATEETSDAEADDAAEADAEAGETADEEIVEESSESDEDEPEDELTAAEVRRRQLLIEGDRLFLQGDYAAAEQRYREAKDAFEEGTVVERADPVSDPDLLSPAGQVYWREYLAGAETELETRIFIPLELLTEEHPEFVPGHIEYAQRLRGADRTSEALATLERATSLYPNSAELAVARVNALAESEEWLQAAIAARQFALLNPDDPLSSELETRSEEYQDRFRRRLRGRLTRNAIGNAITGALGFALTGNIFGPLSAIETTVLLIRGESAVGESIANRAARELDLIEDEEVVAYVNDMGQELAALAGRGEFEYEFYVVAEDELNAFALPGGKIFVNAGAITRTETGAEFAGLLAHELSHAVLSHGFQLVTGGNLTANVLQFVPYGGLATNLAVLRYSRDMERQADALGTQILASSPYAADGMHALMQTLYEETEHRGRFDWLSTHPDVPERIENIETLIIHNGYNRFAFEGIERHLEIRARVEQLLQEDEKIDTDLEGEPDEEVDTGTDQNSDDESETEPDSSPNPGTGFDADLGGLEPFPPASTVNFPHGNPALDPTENSLLE
ncbi:MAG: M48 family metalloprotease [Elainellaceae cyanobacterium]